MQLSCAAHHLDDSAHARSAGCLPKGHSRGGTIFVAARGTYQDSWGSRGENKKGTKGTGDLKHQRCSLSRVEDISYELHVPEPHSAWESPLPSPAPSGTRIGKGGGFSLLSALQKALENQLQHLKQKPESAHVPLWSTRRTLGG